MDGIRTGKKIKGTRLSGGDSSRITASYGRLELAFRRSSLSPLLLIRNY